MSDWQDPDDAPIVTRELAERGEWRRQGKVIREATGTWTKSLGRPPIGNAPKEAVSLRLDRDVLSYFRKTGPGWQTRMNSVLRKAAGLGQGMQKKP